MGKWWKQWQTLFSWAPKSLQMVPQFSSKASVLRCSAFFMVQLSHPYMTTGKIIALTIWTFVRKMVSLLLTHFLGLPLLFFQGANIFYFMSVVTVHSDFGVQENKICQCFYFFPIYFPWVMGPDTMILVFWMLSFKWAFSLSSFTLIISFTLIQNQQFKVWEKQKDDV